MAAQRMAEGGTAVNWLDDLGAEPVGLPAVLVVRAASTSERRAWLRRLAETVLGVPVRIGHHEGRRPLVLDPAGTGLHLSSASRGGLAALAVAGEQVGVDLELPSVQEPPWGVLHPEEASWLRSLPPPGRARGFADLWAVKEAYLKAIRTGLSREPASFAVRIGGVVSVVDPQAPAPLAFVELRRLKGPAGPTAVAVAALASSWP